MNTSNFDPSKLSNQFFQSTDMLLMGLKQNIDTFVAPVKEVKKN
jgi:hypothetical protein